VESVWDRLYNITEISPSLNPKNLSSILKGIGSNRIKQDRIFEKLSKTEEQLIYDLSVVFSRSEGINFAEKGVNKDKIHIPQVNLALLCSANVTIQIPFFSVKPANTGNITLIQQLWN